jgi:hypothetical protein
MRPEPHSVSAIRWRSLTQINRARWPGPAVHALDNHGLSPARILKKVSTVIDAVPTTFTADITLGYPSAVSNNSAGQDLIASSVVNSLSGAASFFAASHAFASDTAGVPVDVTFKNVGNAAGYKPSTSQKPLWQAAGLSFNPGGMFDIILLTTTNNSGANVNVQLVVEYVPNAG